MNPIEHLWDALGRAVYERIQPRDTLRDLRRFLMEEWNNIPQARITNLIRSMRSRCAALIRSRGGPTKYWTSSLNNIRIWVLAGGCNTDFYWKRLTMNFFPDNFLHKKIDNGFLSAQPSFCSKDNFIRVIIKCDEIQSYFASKMDHILFRLKLKWSTNRTLILFNELKWL